MKLVLKQVRRGEGIGSDGSRLHALIWNNIFLNALTAAIITERCFQIEKFSLIQLKPRLRNYKNFVTQTVAWSIQWIRAYAVSGHVYTACGIVKQGQKIRLSYKHWEQPVQLYGNHRCTQLKSFLKIKASKKNIYIY